MMTRNARFVEQANIVSGFIPVDLQTGSKDGDWVSLKGYQRCTIVFFKEVGTAGDDPTITVQQTKDVADTGGLAKGVNFTDLHTKTGTQTTTGLFTHVTQAAASTYTDAASAEVAALWVIDITPDMMDIANGFDCLRANVDLAADNSAQLGCLLYILWPAKYAGDPLDSAIID